MIFKSSRILWMADILIVVWPWTQVFNSIVVFVLFNNGCTGIKTDVLWFNMYFCQLFISKWMESQYKSINYQSYLFPTCTCHHLPSNSCSMFGIRDEILSGEWNWGNDEAREIRWEWSEMEKARDEGVWICRCETVFSGVKNKQKRRSARRHCMKVRRIQGSDSAYFGRFNDRTVVTCDSYI